MRSVEAKIQFRMEQSDPIVERVWRKLDAPVRRAVWSALIDLDSMGQRLEGAGGTI